MKTKFLLSAFILVLFSLLVVSSCKKESSATSDSTETIAKELASAESAFDDDAMFADDNFLNAELLKSIEITKHPFAPCAKITVDTTGGIRVRTIDFGTTNCLCNDGRTRRGKIIVTFSGPRLKPGATNSTTFENYFVNDNQVSGTTTMINNGLDAAGNLTWTHTIDKTITLKSGDVTHWTGTRTREWTDGIKTPLDWTDDVCLITGSTTVTRPNGNTRTCSIMTPLRKEMSCHNFVSGSVKIVRTDKPDILLDYGTGDCDNIATITVNGEPKTIKL